MRGGDGLDQAREDLRQLGATEAQVEFQYGRREDAFEVWPEVWPAWEAFELVQTQWDKNEAGVSGLDYTRVRDGLAMAGVDVTPEIFKHLRVIEASVLDTLNKERPKPES